MTPVFAVPAFSPTNVFCVPGTLKTELLHRQIWHSQAEVKLAIFDYVETFYNRRRLHSALEYQSPAEFEAHAKN